MTAVWVGFVVYVLAFMAMLSGPVSTAISRFGWKAVRYPPDSIMTSDIGVIRETGCGRQRLRGAPPKGVAATEHAWSLSAELFDVMKRFMPHWKWQAGWYFSGPSPVMYISRMHLEGLRRSSIYN